MARSAAPVIHRSRGRTRRIVAGLGALSFAVASVAIGNPSVSAGKGSNPQPPGNPDPKGQLVELQLLAFNDYHGHVEASSPGTVDGQPAGGAEYQIGRAHLLYNYDKLCQ